MAGLWRELLTSLAIVAMLATVWGVVRDHIHHWSATRRGIVFALILGLGSAGLVATASLPPAGFGPAPFYGPVVLAAYYGGIRAAVLALIPTLAADLLTFGPALAQITILGAIAVAIRLHRLRLRAVKPRHLVVVALACAATTVVGVAPPAIRTGGADALPTLACITLVAFLVTLLAGLMIWKEHRRRERERTGAILRLAVDTLPDCLSVKDVDGRFLIANPATAHALGAASPDALIGKSDAEFFPPDIAAGYRADEEAALTGLQPMKIEQSMPHANGSVGWYTTLKAPVFSPSGTLIGLITHNRDITRRKHLESELAESRQRLDDALTLMAQGLVMFDADGRIVYCNERYGELFPLTADVRKPGARLVDIIRVSMARGEIEDPPPEGVTLEAWCQTLANNLRRDGDRSFRTHDGRWLESHVRGTRDGGCHIVVSDVTERKQAEATLRAAEERWNFALESAGQGVWDFDFREGRTYHSRTWKAMLGYGPDELPDVASLWLDLMHPDDRPAALKANEDHINGLNPIFEAEFRMRHKDGHWIWVLDRGKVIEFDAEGRSIRAIGTHTDITASKMADTAIRASEARFRSLFELSPVGFALVDVATGRVVTRNPALAEMLGRAVDDRTVLTLADILAEPNALPPLLDVAEAGRVAPVECEIRRPGGAPLPVIVTGSAVLVQEDAAQVMLVFQDISMRRGYEERLWQLANIDSLTGLPNRMQFNARLADAIERSRRSGQSFAVAFFDLDNFKDVNDSFGHGAGDQLLAETARRVRRAIRVTDTLARVGGDEFAAILDDVGDGDSITRPLEAMIAAINEPVDVAGAPRRFSTSIGVALFPGDAADADELMKNADIALYRAKQTGRNRFEFFRPELRSAIDHRARLIGDAEAALNDGRVDVLFKPVVGGHGSRCVGLTVMPALRGVDGRLLSDEHLDAALSDANVAQTIGRLTRRRAIAAAASWHRSCLGFGRLSFDLVPADLRSDHFVVDLLADLAACNLAPTTISLRVTSAALTARGAERVTPMLRRLHDLGVELVLANFGAGQTSLGLLQDLPIDWVSFDGDIVGRLDTSPTDQAIVIGLVDLVHRLGIATGATGVVTVFQADFLIGLGCEQLRGPLFSMALDADATRLYLDRFGQTIDDLDHVADDIPYARPAVALA